jgi:hypothetical protein
MRTRKSKGISLFQAKDLYEQALSSQKRNPISNLKVALQALKILIQKKIFSKKP